MMRLGWLLLALVVVALTPPDLGASEPREIVEEVCNNLLADDVAEISDIEIHGGDHVKSLVLVQYAKRDKGYMTFARLLTAEVDDEDPTANGAQFGIEYLGIFPWGRVPNQKVWTPQRGRPRVYNIGPEKPIFNSAVIFLIPNLCPYFDMAPEWREEGDWLVGSSPDFDISLKTKRTKEGVLVPSEVRLGKRRFEFPEYESIYGGPDPRPTRIIAHDGRGRKNEVVFKQREFSTLRVVGALFRHTNMGKTQFVFPNLKTRQEFVETVSVEVENDSSSLLAELEQK